MSKKEYTDIKTPPARQGFYDVILDNEDELIAEWRESTKGEPKAWFQYVTDDPTVAKKPVPLAGVASYRPAGKDAVAKMLKRELTVDEKVAEAVEAYRRLESLYKEAVQDAPPEARLLKEGDEVVVGALPEARVVKTLDEGRIVVISYRSINHNYGRPLDNGIVYGAWHWTNVALTRTAADFSRVSESKLYDAFRTSSLESLLHRVRHGLNANPDYQRGYTWTYEDQQRYLDSLFSSRELGRFVFVKRPYPTIDEILDGKQRLNCLWLFYTSRLDYRGVYWHQLSVRDRDRIENRSVQFAELPGAELSRAELLQAFLELNAAGVPQTEEHLAYVEGLLAQETAVTAK